MFDSDDYPGRYDNPSKMQLFKFYLKHPIILLNNIWYIVKENIKGVIELFFDFISKDIK